MNDTSSPDSITPVAYTLEPLRSLGPAALDTSSLPDLLKLTLRELQICYPGVHHHCITIRADDIFAHPPPHLRLPDPIPAHGQLTRATFAVYFNTASRPHIFEIRPPNTVTYQYPADAPRIVAWMDKIHVRLLASITRTATLLLLAVATVLAPALADGDSDDDDPITDRHVTSLHQH